MSFLKRLIPSRSTFVAVGGASAIGIGYYASRDREVKAPVMPVVTSITSSLQTTKFTLYQFESCPFCRKARGVLDYYNIPYDVVEVHPLNKRELKEIAPDYKKVPVLHLQDGASETQIRDSKMIIDAVMLLNEPGCVRGASTAPPETPMTKGMWPANAEARAAYVKEGLPDSEVDWIMWTDKVLVQLIVMNIYRNWSESAETFSYLLTHPTFSLFEKYSGAWSGTLVMWIVAVIRKRKYQIPDERQALYECLDAFVNSLGGRPFLGGDRPGRADFNIFGILRSIENFTTEKDIFEHSKIQVWYQKMLEAVGTSTANNLIARG